MATYTAIYTTYRNRFEEVQKVCQEETKKPTIQKALEILGQLKTLVELVDAKQGLENKTFKQIKSETKKLFFELKGIYKTFEDIGYERVDLKPIDESFEVIDEEKETVDGDFLLV